MLLTLHLTFIMFFPRSSHLRGQTFYSSHKLSLCHLLAICRLELAFISILISITSTRGIRYKHRAVRKDGIYACTFLLTVGKPCSWTPAVNILCPCSNVGGCKPRLTLCNICALPMSSIQILPAWCEGNLDGIGFTYCLTSSNTVATGTISGYGPLMLQFH